MTDRTRAEARLIRMMERFGSKRFLVLRSVESVRKDYKRQCAAEALRDAADAIQAMHPGEVKNSVVFLRDRADNIDRALRQQGAEDA